MEHEEKYITLSFVLSERKFKAILLPNMYTATKKVFNSNERYRSSTTQDTTALGSK